MTLEQLRIFVAVAEREHMTAAARALELTQSAVSAAISGLEQQYQTQLFDRIGRGIALTDAGRVFLSEARSVLACAATAEAALLDLAGLKRGALTLAGSQTVANYWLPQLIARFSTTYPGVAIRMSVENTARVARLASEGAIDIGYVEGDVDDPALSVQRVAEDELILIAPPGHSWLDRPPRSKGDLASSRWVLREPGSGTRAAAERALGALGLALRDVDVALTFPTNESVRSAVEAGAGVAVMSRIVAMRALKAGLICEVALDLPPRAFTLIRRRDRFVTKAMAAFMEFVAQAHPAP